MLFKFSNLPTLLNLSHFLLFLFDLFDLLALLSLNSLTSLTSLYNNESNVDLLSLLSNFEFCILNFAFPSAGAWGWVRPVNAFVRRQGFSDN